jgi:hypothetical protein
MAKARKTSWMNFLADFRVKNGAKFKSKPTEVLVAAGKIVFNTCLIKLGITQSTRDPQEKSGCRCQTPRKLNSRLKSASKPAPAR